MVSLLRHQPRWANGNAWLRTLLLSSLILVCAALPAFAQGSQAGILRGTVTTADKLSLPGATVNIKSAALQGERTAVTESDGSFLFRGLPPGMYAVTFTMNGMATIQKQVEVPLGGVAQVAITMALANVSEVVQVTAEAPTMVTTPVIGSNLKHEDIALLASRRDIEGIANLAASVTESTAPNAQQLNINGAFAYDNLFMVNGVDVNDNLFGSPQNVFIEDAVQETQVLTSGIPAEYGRFSGGVVNAITKSGSNKFSGSVRLNLTDPTWSKLTPYEAAHNVDVKSKINNIWEGTFGGPLLKDRLWFFGAGRLAKTTAANTFPETGAAYSTVNDNKRGEIKLTGSPNNDHTLTVSFIDAPTNIDNTPAIGGYEIDPHTLISEQNPNWTLGANWRGILASNLFAEAQYSRRHFSFQNAGGTSTVMADSPFFTLALGDGGWAYNAPYFDATDPEDRDNQQATGSLSYSVQGAGRHDFKAGYEWFRSQRNGGNSQSPTSYVFNTDFVTTPDGGPVYDANGYLIPIFSPGDTQAQHWIAVRGASMHVDTQSVFLQDHWMVNNLLSLDLGARFEHVNGMSTGGIQGVKTNSIVPRLAAAFSPLGNSKLVFHVTYGHYAGRYNEAQVGANSPVGNPALTVGIYDGPAGQGRGFAPGLDPANYQIVFGSFPTANVSMASGLSSPITKEFTVSAGGDLWGKGSAEVAYVWRRMNNFIEDFIDVANGTTDVVQNGQDFGTFTNIVFRNSDIPKRDYQALVFQANYRILPTWVAGATWTYQLKNDGNFQGENANQPGISSAFGDYPGANGLPSIYQADRNYPIGKLYDYQQTKLRLWSSYTLDMHKGGRLSLSGLLRVDSGLTYSLVAAGQSITAIQSDLLSQEGYPDAPSSQSVFFGARGSQSFKGYALLDASLNYDIPIIQSLRPWVKFDVYNLFNNQTLTSWNTTVKQDPASPVDAMGLHTGYVLGSLYGQATGPKNYPLPFQGQTGGRTFRIAFGFRF